MKKHNPHLFKNDGKLGTLENEFGNLEYNCYTVLAKKNYIMWNSTNYD